MDDGFEFDSNPSSHHVPARRFERHSSRDDRVETSVPKFEPPSSAPIPAWIKSPERPRTEQVVPP
jgi:hypothetical protein